MSKGSGKPKRVFILPKKPKGHPLAHERSIQAKRVAKIPVTLPKLKEPKP